MNLDTTKVAFETMSVQTLILLFQDGSLNLEPGFQRKSVWTLRDRTKLIESIVRGYPLPSIFLYLNKSDDGNVRYDVIDGKQRLETIFMFCGVGKFRKEQKNLVFQCDLDGTKITVNYNLPGVMAHLLSYKIPVIQVDSDLENIHEIFVRINSLGKPLTRAEKLNTKYLNTDFLKCAQRLAKQFNKQFRENRILSKKQIQRMKDLELVCEFIASIVTGGPIHKKQALDKVIGNAHIHAATLRKAKKQCAQTFNAVFKLHPNIKLTRFSKLSDFYSLFLVTWSMLFDDDLALTDAKALRVANALLTKFSTEVDKVNVWYQKHKSLLNADVSQIDRELLDYFHTVRENTDSRENRAKRHQILKGLLASLFQQKDSQRIFTPVQRRIIWNSTPEPKRICPNPFKNPKCAKKLTWDNFTVDHTLAWVKGGKTDLGNAQLMCKSCNSVKGKK